MLKKKRIKFRKRNKLYNMIKSEEKIMQSKITKEEKIFLNSFDLN